MKQQITKRGLWISVILLVVVPLLCLLCCQVILTLATSEISKSENPPAMLQESDLVGTWKADYGRCHGVDTLILRADGTFKQVYENQCEDYVYETLWNEWWLERFPDGRVRVHLKGARYYLSGIRMAEEEGLEESFHDPFAFHQGKPAMWYPGIDENETSIVHMVRKLVLNVRVLPSGELVLDHMWPSSEYGFGDADLFHRVETPSPLETPAP